MLEPTEIYMGCAGSLIVDTDFHFHSFSKAIFFLLIKETRAIITQTSSHSRLDSAIYSTLIVSLSEETASPIK
jgi:hypothetical protein